LQFCNLCPRNILFFLPRWLWTLISRGTKNIFLHCCEILTFLTHGKFIIKYQLKGLLFLEEDGGGGGEKEEEEGGGGAEVTALGVRVRMFGFHRFHIFQTHLLWPSCTFKVGKVTYSKSKLIEFPKLSAKLVECTPRQN